MTAIIDTLGVPPVLVGALVFCSLYIIYLRGRVTKSVERIDALSGGNTFLAGCVDRADTRSARCLMLISAARAWRDAHTAGRATLAEEQGVWAALSAVEGAPTNETETPHAEL